MTYPEWEEGAPANLEAAAEDADAWLALMEACINAGRWKFSQPDSLDKLRGCRANLRRLLTTQPVQQSLPQP